MKTDLLKMLSFLAIISYSLIFSYSCNNNKNALIGGKWHPYSTEKAGKVVFSEDEYNNDPEILPRYFEFVNENELKDVHYNYKSKKIRRIKVKSYSIKGNKLTIKHEDGTNSEATFLIDGNKLTLNSDNSTYVYIRK